MDVNRLFNYHSGRAYRARLGRQLQPWIIVLKVSTVATLLVGVGLLFAGFAAGWAIFGLAAIPAMISEWYDRGLKHVVHPDVRQTVDDMLETQLLAQLPEQPNPKDIARAISSSKSGAFFAVRFGIGGGFIEQIVSDNRDDSVVIFERAVQLAKDFDSLICSGVLIVAILEQLPNRDTLLGHLQLSEDDLLRGIHWFHRLEEIIKHQESLPKSPGGIGRDWTFGWIPYLSKFGTNVSGTPPVINGVRDEIIDSMMASLHSGRGALNLVGPTGVGKTEIVTELASRLMNPSEDVPQGLHYRQVFMLDASRLLSAASEKGSLESLVQTILSEAYLAKNIIICLDNAQLFFENGVGSLDISSVLMPILEAGRLPMILTMDEQAYLRISRQLPSLASGVQRLSVPATDEFGTFKVLEEKIPVLEYRFKVIYMYQALKEAYRLSARYVYDIAMPGQSISLLESAAEYADNGIVTAGSVQLAVERATGIRTTTVGTDSERDTLLNLEALIHERMIGQDRAVAVVSDALRRARAGVRNQQRPVGTFLFLGPTGVGKTELAKSLAAVYYGGEDSIIRLDMNEFVTEDDVTRLIADGTEDPNSLTARVMKQPFSVILLDEIEKAHSSVLSTLLQLLDEGILRDGRNREISFRDTIIIATSNAGSDRIQEYIHRGYQLEQFEEKFVDELVDSRLFHPEFLNRFDEIVVFRPLIKAELLMVVDIILKSINKILDDQKISVSVTAEARQYLVDAGYDPRLGARPMRRVVQRAVESTVAKQLLAGNLKPGESFELNLDQVKSVIDTKQRADQLMADRLS